LPWGDASLKHSYDVVGDFLAEVRSGGLSVVCCSVGWVVVAAMIVTPVRQFAGKEARIGLLVLKSRPGQWFAANLIERYSCEVALRVLLGVLHFASSFCKMEI
jgi:hypothetical protein